MRVGPAPPLAFQAAPRALGDLPPRSIVWHRRLLGSALYFGRGATRARSPAWPSGCAGSPCCWCAGAAPGYRLGLTHARTMQTIVLPQAFRRMLPALGQRGRQLDQELVADAGGVLRGEV